MMTSTITTTITTKTQWMRLMAINPFFLPNRLITRADGLHADPNTEHSG